MVTEDNSIPVKSNIYRLAEDIFYTQFNDISFYIEDVNQENFFHCVLSKLFDELSIDKIFPLGGKENVINESRENLGNRKKVYIVDKDFDDILDKVENYNNLFYLERYSIENYLLEEKSLIYYIIGEKPRLSIAHIVDRINYDDSMANIGGSLNEFILLHVVVQSKCPSLKNISLNYERFVTFNNGNFIINPTQLQWYKDEIQSKLYEIDMRLTLNAQLKIQKKKLKFNNFNEVIKHYPGKYLIKMIKQLIESTFGLTSRNYDSFCYRLADKCEFGSLTPIKIKIDQYINN